MKLLAAIFIVMMFALVNVSAQNQGQPAEETILAEGSGKLTQPMFERVVDFFEWTLETKLTESERAALQSEIVEQWRARNCAEIEGVRFILRLADDRKNWDDEDLMQLKALYKNRFSREFERTGANKINSLILGILRV